MSWLVLIRRIRPLTPLSLGLLSLLAGTGGSVARAQSVANPGFEAGALSSWQTVVFGSQGSVNVGSTAHSGRYGLVQGPNNGTEVAYQDVAGLTPGQSYVVSVWVASSAATSTTVSLAIHDTTGQNWASTDIVPVNGWQQFSQTYAVNRTGAIRIHLYENPGAETTYWDDVTLEPVLPLNGSFETGTLSSWQTVVFGNQGSVAVGGAAHSGNYGLVQGPNSGNEVAYQDLFGLVPGQTYLVSAWVAASSANAGTITLAVHDTEGGNWQSTGFTPSNFWQRVSQAYTVNGTGAMRIHLYTNPGSEVTYWDDVTVTSTNGQSAAALFAGDTALWGGFNNGGGLWANSSFLSISPSAPSKEYIRLNGQPIAIENAPVR